MKIKRWIRRALVATVGLVLGVVAVAYGTAVGASAPVGFQVIRAASDSGRSFAVGVWYPTTARAWPTTQVGAVLMNVARNAAVQGQALPLVVISHGNGGGPTRHADLAMALAAAGYVVAAPMHRGDNFLDQGRAGEATLFHERVAELRATIDAMTVQWPDRARLDTSRVAAFGFSAGGFTVLAAAGAQPNLGQLAAHCAAAPEFVCRVLRETGSALLRSDTSVALPRFERDPRIRAIIVAAPGLGFTMDSAALSGVTVPLQLWNGEADGVVPYATNARRIREVLGMGVDFRSVAGAGHPSFLVPCGLLRPSGLCSDPDGFDRRAFHATMNAAAISFLDTRLKRRRSP
ncbi:MAG: alpha/beta hydrolase [Gemmatimonadaceae bacterium]|nr:alpha/beta hydrolase [Gemmatimonadaceae bacterium]